MLIELSVIWVILVENIIFWRLFCTRFLCCGSFLGRCFVYFRPSLSSASEKIELTQIFEIIGKMIVCICVIFWVVVLYECFELCVIALDKKNCFICVLEILISFAEGMFEAKTARLG